MTKTFNATSTADDVLTGVNLTGKRYLITGISSGIGLETARALVAFVMAVSHGMAVQAKAGFKRETLEAVAEQALSTWPGRGAAA